jgi:OFA family oxalate/formate antiporter-like MFS transporter
MALGGIFAVVTILCGQLLFTPPKDYVPPMPANAKAAAAMQDSTKHDWTPKEIFKSWQFYALVLMFTISTQSGLLIIANAAGLLKKAAADVPFLAANAWILVSFGGLVKRLGTGGHRFLLR